MIRKLVRQMLAAQIFSALTVSLCLLIDNIMIGQFLGEECIAAYGLANPLLLAVGAVASLLSAGVQVVCSKALGKGAQEEANGGYSSAVAVAGGVSITAMVLVILFRSFFARILGAGSSGELFEETRGYLAGFSLGAPATMGALILVPFLQMAGKSGLLIAAVLGMTVTDIGLDLLNVLVFHGGMFGMGLGSAISYYVALVVGGSYFISKKSVFHFSRKAVRKKTIADLFQAGIPAGFNMISSVILMFLMNRLLGGLGGSAAVAAYAVSSSLGGAANCVTTGIGGVSLTLNSIFYHEEDEGSMKKLLALLWKYGAVLSLGMGILIIVIAPAAVSLFIPAAGKTQEMAILGLRLFAAGMIPCCLNAAVKNAWQACGRIRLMEIFSLLEGAGFPILAAFLLSRFLGVTGAWFAFAAGEILATVFIMILVQKKTGRVAWRDGAALLLEKNFGAPENERFETDIRTMQEVSEAAQRAEQFCLERGQDPKTSSHIALCIEEMAGNTIQHGFSGDGKQNHLSMLIMHKGDGWILRFRDDCGAFDPLHYVPTEGKDALGIRLVMAMVKDARYTYSMNMNNLVLRI